MSSDLRAGPPGPSVEAVERAADGEDGATLDGEARLPDHLDAAQLGLSREPFQVLQDLAAQCCGSSTRT
jgi:hypothetical protein